LPIIGRIAFLNGRELDAGSIEAPRELAQMSLVYGRQYDDIGAGRMLVRSCGVGNLRGESALRQVFADNDVLG
jgi:hypothetical protein